jgi:SAM-dependent methyltransferase
MIKNLTVIKFILACFFSFSDFKDKNKSFFGLDKKYLFFSLNSLIKIFYLLFLNKTKILFNIYGRKNFYFHHKNFFIKYKFSVQWSKSATYYWNNIFKEFKLYNKKINILEIGSFEGFSTLFFLENLKKSNITCVDTWKNYYENNSVNFKNIEKIFDKNTYPFKKRILKFKMSSNKFFNKNYNKNYDLIYVDGDHYFKNVYHDLENSYKVLSNNGIMIIDDFLTYNFYKNNLNENPFGAIITFLNKYKNNIEIILITNQIIIKKKLKL